MRTLWILMLALSMVLVQAQDDRYMAGLDIYPKNVTMEAGDILQFTAVVRSHSGMMHTPQNLQWYASGGGTINQAGRYVAGQKGGNYTVTVSYGGFQATASVEIKTFSPTIAHVKVSPSSVKLKIGESRRFTATAYDAYNHPVAFTPYWETTGGGTIDSSGNFRATFNGDYMVSAKDPASGCYGTAFVSVGHGPGPHPVASLNIYPQTVQIAPGQTYNFTATAYDYYGNVVSNVKLSWNAQGGKINKWGQYTAGSTPGTYQITASVHHTGVQGTAWVTIVGSTPSTGRIVVTHADIGGGNMFTPKAKIRVQVFGTNIQTVKLYAITFDGDFKELQAFSVGDGQEVYFNCKYDRFETQYLEIRLYDKQGQVVAKDRRDAS